MATHPVTTCIVRRLRSVYRPAAATAILLVSSPAFSQLENATGKLTTVQTWLTTIGLSIFTVCFMVCGYRMAFSGATWGDIWKIAVGGVLAGGSAGLAATFAG